MTSLIFALALYLSANSIHAAAVHLTTGKAGDLTVRLVLAALTWGYYHWLTH